MKLQRHTAVLTGAGSGIGHATSMALARHGQVELLINNAGVALGGTFEQVSEARRPECASG